MDIILICYLYVMVSVRLPYQKLEARQMQRNRTTRLSVEI